MIDGLFAVLENAVVRYTVTGEIPQPLGSRHPSITPFQGFQTRDSWIIVAVGNDALWSKFCGVIERGDLVDHPSFKSNPLRTRNVKELNEILSVELEKKTTGEWSRIFDEAGLPYSPINNIRDISEDSHIRHRKMLVEVDQPGLGKVRIAGSPIRLSETPGEVYAPAPRLGQHTEEVLQGILRYSTEEIESLRREGVIGGMGG
jgi:CoA:oxalate CoA-transferase